MNDYGERLDQTTVRFERLLPGPIERVWSYLVEDKKRARWLCGGDIEQAVDGRVDMHFHNMSLSVEGDIPRPAKYRDKPEKVSFVGKVTRCVAPHLLEHTWEFENESSVVLYELEERGDKVKLVLTHRRLDDDETVLGVCGGWHTHLNMLVDVLEENDPRPFYRMQQQFESEYAERLGLGEAS